MHVLALYIKCTFLSMMLMCIGHSRCYYTHMSTCYCSYTVTVQVTTPFSDKKLRMGMFGSSVNGFGTKSSDLDMSLTFEGRIEVIVAYCSDMYSVLQA